MASTEVPRRASKRLARIADHLVAGLRRDSVELGEGLEEGAVAEKPERGAMTRAAEVREDRYSR